MGAMETTFITIHDLTEEAHILYSSDSIVDILGHTPDEVVGKSTWTFFRPDHVPMAQQVHTRGVKLDKAAVLSYCDILNRHGQWVNCECCFTIVYNVMVCCTSIYRPGIASQKRAVEAPLIRKMFSSSPDDPRYHMLTHLSHKFEDDTKAMNAQDKHEPRAALFLNRFTRTLTVMYATSGIEQIVGIPSEQMKGRSFYFCIQENCLEDAVRCLESAKGNDSIAYLRFWYRDPRQDDPPPDADTSGSEADTDEVMTDLSASDAETDRATPTPETPLGQGQNSSRDASGSNGTDHSGSDTTTSRAHASQFGFDPNGETTASSSPEDAQFPPIELEAVVSCTSDGLVVCLRKARPILPPSGHPQVPNPANTRGIFATPWAAEPIFVPGLQPQPHYPYGAASPDGQLYLGQAAAQARGGPAQQALMNSIREQAVFAWALTGINGSLEQYSHGTPAGNAQPSDGFSIWAPERPHGGPYGEGGYPDGGGDGSSGYGSGNSYGSANGHGMAKA